MQRMTKGGTLPLLMVAVMLFTSFAGVVAGEMAAPTIDYSTYSTEQADWVLIAAALHDPVNYETDPDYIEAFDLYNYFVGLGLDDEHIILLVDYDTANPAVDGPATKGETFASLDFLADVTTDDDFLFIGILDWGYPSYPHYWVDMGDEPLYDYELSAKFDQLSYNRLVVTLVFRHSGGWEDEILRNDRLFLASCKNNIDTDVDFKLSWGLTDPNADLNGNGRIHFEEAFRFVKEEMVDDGLPKPIKKDDAAGCTFAPGV